MKEVEGKTNRPRVLVVKLSSLGDLFHSLPAVHNLKVGLDAEIHWVVQREYVELVERFSDVDRVVAFPRHHFLARWRSFVRDLRDDEYEFIVDLQGLLKSAMVTRLARGKTRIGPSFRREGAGLFYDAVAGPRRKNRHAVEQNLDIVGYLGLQRLQPAFPVDFPKVDLRGNQPRVAVMPRSRWPSKNWPAECFAEVARRLQQALNASIFVMGGPADREVGNRIAQSLDGQGQNLAGQTDLIQTGSALQKMDLLIANDSGPAHMAAALGVPTLMIFGPTDPVRTGPYGAQHRVVHAALPCRPCLSRVCRRPGIPCLSGITPGKVAEAALEMLTKAFSSRS